MTNRSNRDAFPLRSDTCQLSWLAGGCQTANPGVILELVPGDEPGTTEEKSECRNCNIVVGVSYISKTTTIALETIGHDDNPDSIFYPSESTVTSRTAMHVSTGTLDACISFKDGLSSNGT